MAPLSSVVTRLLSGHTGGDKYHVASLGIEDETAFPLDNYPEDDAAACEPHRLVCKACHAYLYPSRTRRQT
jgi:hypothetical protein